LSELAAASHSGIDITILAGHHDRELRTTLEIEADVLDAAKSLAAARGVSVGSALSELARRGAAARTPIKVRNGFPVFQLPPGTPGVGADEVAAALENDDRKAAREFKAPAR
jgi:hypothetical protein